MKNWLRIPALVLVAQVAWPAHRHPPHTDGIEPYYHPKQLVQWMKTVPEDLHPYLFAGEEDMVWWKEARFGIFVHWGPSSMLKCSMSWGRKGPRPQHSSDGTVTKGIPQEIYDNQYKLLEAADFDADEVKRLEVLTGGEAKASQAGSNLSITMDKDRISPINTLMSEVWEQDHEIHEEVHRSTVGGDPLFDGMWGRTAERVVHRHR